MAPGTPLDRAGARAGDLLLRWHRPPAPPANPEAAAGVIESALHWGWLGREQAPRGDLLVTGERDGEERTFVVGDGEWASQVEDRVLGEFETDVAAARARIEAGDVEPGIVLFDRLIACIAGPAFRLARCSVRLTEVSALEKQGQWERAREIAETARADSDERLCQEAMLERIAWIHRVRARPDEARQVYEELLALRRSAAEGSLLVADSLSLLGALLGEHGDLDASEGCVRRALEIRSKEAPGSISEAISLNHLGLLAWDRRRLQEAEDYLRRAYDIVEQRDPESTFAAVLLNNLGTSAHQAGRLEEAETWYRRSVEIHRRRDPLGRGVARGLANLGVAAMERGDFRQAESYLQESLRIEERESAEGVRVAGTLDSLGVLAVEQGDLDLARQRFRRSVEILERKAPGSMDLSEGLMHLAHVNTLLGWFELAKRDLDRALEIGVDRAPGSVHVAAILLDRAQLTEARGDLETAADDLKRAVELARTTAPEWRDVALALHRLGVLSAELGDRVAAQKHLQEALENLRQRQARSPAVAEVLTDLGAVALEGGDPELAERHLREAVAIEERLGGVRYGLANSLHQLARTRAARGDLEQAAGLLERAADVFEAHVSRLAGSRSAQERYRARGEGLYRDLTGVLLALGRETDAFAAQERRRARGFLAMLAERELYPADGVPAELSDARRRLAARSDRLQEQLAAVTAPEGEARIDELRLELIQLAADQEELTGRIRQAAPRLGELYYPRPLDLAEVRRRLDPGTVLLSYEIGEEASELFVVTRERGLEVHAIPTCDHDLRRSVRLLRRLVLESRGTRPGDDWKESLRTVARRLYRLLIAPAEARIAGADRILIVPDEAQRLLPFGALVRDPGGEDAARSGQYLAAWKPLRFALSATVDAQTRSLRPPPWSPPPLRLAAFGDPELPPRQAAEDGHDSPRRGRAAGPLPASRREVERIAALFPPPTTRVFLGRDAVEEEVKRLAGRVGVIHFATHALLDGSVPLNSGIVLSIPDDPAPEHDNGLLQAWEIFESVRVEADLVVLSACESALGAERASEGLIGLTRAFQYAGARSVLASLWKVDDAVTAELMLRFHRHLQAGSSKDEALRAAQRELIEGPVSWTDERGEAHVVDASAPFYWAAFALTGDWR